jgi:hypothetical protein
MPTITRHDQVTAAGVNIIGQSVWAGAGAVEGRLDTTVMSGLMGYPMSLMLTAHGNDIYVEQGGPAVALPAGARFILSSGRPVVITASGVPSSYFAHQQVTTSGTFVITRVDTR